MDWLSQLFEMTPLRGRLELRCSYGASWRIDQGPGEANEIPYRTVWRARRYWTTRQEAVGCS